MKQPKQTSIDFNGKSISFKTGHLAFKADSAVEVQMGETVLLAIVTVDEMESELDYFPLSVEYIEKFYAGGIISGSRFVKRERRPSDEAVLKARQVDHSIRSLFPKGFKRAVSVVLTVLSYDGVNDPDDLSVTAASMALMLSSVPFEGPSASVKVAINNAGEMVLNPEAGAEDLDTKFIISMKDDNILNIEGYANEVSDEKMGDLIDFAVESAKPLLQVQKEFAEKAGKEKFAFAQTPAPIEIIEKVRSDYGARITEALYDKPNRKTIIAEIKSEMMDNNSDYSFHNVDTAVEYVSREIMRTNILKSEKRTSGRKLDEVRELEIDVNVLPRVHGSALFSRGITQTLTIVTLGSTRLSQTLESFEGEEEKRFMHHYNGPSYSFGDAGRFSYYPGRREIGHGHITENAFEKLLPSEEEFPYTIRVVSEILSQNGSSSMAAATATSLSLMDAGVPIKAAVAGIAVGLVTNDDDVNEYKLLVDMEDVEDFYGDMDFKVAGTRKGLTAIQLDNKLQGVPVAIMKDAIAKAYAARIHILDATDKVINAPRSVVSKYAPKVSVIKIKTDKIGELIGPGGKNIKKIIEEVGEGVDIDIQDDGTVYVTSVDESARTKAVKMIDDSVGEAEIGKTYTGKVAKLTNYGAFVDVTNAISGLVHVSEITDKFVKDPSEHLKEGQEVQVKVIGIDEQGRINLSIKQAEK